MPDQPALTLTDLPANTKKTVTLGDTKVLLVRTDDIAAGQPTLFAVEAECPHAKGPLEKGVVCNGRLVCPWHTGTFELATGKLLEPPPLRDLKRYPVRLDGEQIFVDPTPIPASAPAPAGQGKHLVFAGGGAATAAGLSYLRDQNFAGKVTVLEPVSGEPVDRTQLTKNSLAGKKPLDTLPLFAPKGQDTLGNLQVDFIADKITNLDAGMHQITLAGGQTLPYDALTLATGSLPDRPAIPGADLPNVFTIRHPDDLRRMEPLLTPGARAVLLGDSFIAFEAASALRQRDLHTTVIARSKLPFAEKFGPAVAEAMMNLHRSKGVNLHTEAEATAISPVAVTLSTGADIPADLVILAVGVTPITGYASNLPAGKKGGFAIGPDLRLAPNLWCAGDIASVDGTRIEHWRLAEQHGRTAAEAMLAYVTDDARGPATPFSGIPLFWTTHFSKRFNYAGHADTWDEIVIDGDPQSLNFMAFYVKDNLVTAVLECGRDTALAALMEHLRNPQTLHSLQQLASSASQSTAS